MSRRKRNLQEERERAEALLPRMKKPPNWGRRKRLDLARRGVVSYRRLAEDIGTKEEG